MKVLKILLTPALLYVLLFTTGSQFSACKKTNTVHDTVIIKDTLTIIDSTSELRNGLVAYYTFTNGSLKDSSGYSNDIIFNNATKTTDRFGQANNAYLFDGSASYMQVHNSTSLNPNNISIMAIVKPNGFYQGACHGNQLVSKGYNDYINGFYTLRFTNPSTPCSSAPDITKEFFYGQYGDTSPSGGASAGYDSAYVKVGQWYNVVYTYDGLESRLYINGVVKDIKLHTTTFAPNTHDLFIGKHEDPAYPYYLNGVIDEIRIYNKALCADDVVQLNALKQ